MRIGTGRRALADRQEDVEERDEEQRRAWPRGSTTAASPRAADGSRRFVASACRSVSAFFGSAGSTGDLVALLVELDVLPLVPLELLAAAALLLRRHGVYGSARRPPTIGSIPRSPPRWYAR